MLPLNIVPEVHAENAGLFVSPGFGIHPSRVIESFELIVVHQGRLHIEEAGVPFHLDAGQTLILWPGRPHCGILPYDRDLSFYWIHFHVSPRSRRPSTVLLPQVSTPARPERLAELFHQFLNEQENGTLLAPEGDLLLALMLLEVNRVQPEPMGAKASGVASLAANYISENFHAGIGAGDVARALQLHPDYLGRIFHRAYGHTLTEAIHRRQVREARMLLRDSRLNIDEIARSCGFSDARYFRRIFFRISGLNPLEYRRQQRRIYINIR